MTTDTLTLSAPETAPLPGTEARERTGSFARLVHVETRKIVDTRAGRALLLVTALATAAIIALMLFTMPAQWLTFRSLTFASAIPQGVLLPILGIVAATSEWSQRTGLVTFTLEPRRTRVALAKLAAACLVGLAAVLVALALGALTNLAGLLWFAGDGSWSMPAAQLGGAVALQLIGVMQGVAFGFALQNGALAIVTFLVLPTIWTVVGALVPWLERVAPWLDLRQATAPLLDGTLHGADWARLGTAVAVWFGVPLALGILRLTRREIK